MLVILVSGKAESGKDEFYKYFHRMYGSKLDIRRFAYGDSVKKIARTLGWNGIKDEKGREMLQWLGDGARRFNKNVWVQKLLYKLNRSLYYRTPDVVIVTDCRYFNEVDLVAKNKGLYHVITVRIDRLNHDSNLTPAQRSHASETELDDYQFNYRIVNDSTLKRYKQTLKHFLSLTIIPEYFPNVEGVYER